MLCSLTTKIFLGELAAEAVGKGCETQPQTMQVMTETPTLGQGS